MTRPWLLDFDCLTVRCFLRTSRIDPLDGVEAVVALGAIGAVRAVGTVRTLGTVRAEGTVETAGTVRAIGTLRTRSDVIWEEEASYQRGSWAILFMGKTSFSIRQLFRFSH